VVHCRLNVNTCSQYPGRVMKAQHVRLIARKLYSSTCSLQCLTSRKTWAEVIVFSSPKCTSCVSDGVRLNGFERSLKYSHVPMIFSSLLSKTPFWSLMDLAILDFFRRIEGSSPEHFVCFPVIVFLINRSMLQRVETGLPEISIDCIWCSFLSQKAKGFCSVECFSEWCTCSIFCK